MAAQHMMHKVAYMLLKTMLMIWFIVWLMVMLLIMIELRVTLMKTSYLHKLHPDSYLQRKLENW